MDGYYFGIDLGKKITVTSYFGPGMKTPGTISMVMGSEEYQIPTALAKRKGVNQWYFGRDAKNQAQDGNATEVEDLYEKAERNEDAYLDGESFSSRDLLAIYLKHLLELTGLPIRGAKEAYLTITVPTLTMEVAEMLTIVMNKLGIPSENLNLIDQRESFYFYALNQDPQLFLHDVMLFDASGTRMKSVLLSRDFRHTPQVVTLDEHIDTIENENRDLDFLHVIEKRFEGKVISSVYLVGDGFDGDWIRNSLSYLVKGRRVFIGKNLYAKGACHSSMVKHGDVDFPFLYVGDHEMKMTISLKVYDMKETRFIPLSKAGESWFDAHGTVEVLLDGTPELEIYIQKADSHSAKVDVLSLNDLPARENRTTRLRIDAKAESDKSARITISDIGFGEISAGTLKNWVHQVSLQGENEWAN